MRGENYEIVLKLSGDGGEYGTVTVVASQLGSAWVEEKIRSVYEAGGLPAFMAKDMARRVVEDVKAEEEKRRVTEVALAAAGVGKRRRKPGLGEPLAFVVVENWWTGNYGGVQSFYGYVEGYYETDYGIRVDLITIDGSTNFEGLGNANAGKYHAAILLTGHGQIVGSNYILEGEINGWDLLDFLDRMMVKGPSRKGIVAGMCFAGHPRVKDTAERRLHTEVRGGDITDPHYSSTGEVPEAERVSGGIALRFSWAGAGYRILKSVNTFYGLGEELPYYVDFYEATKTYVVGPKGK